MFVMRDCADVIEAPLPPHTTVTVRPLKLEHRHPSANQLCLIDSDNDNVQSYSWSLIILQRKVDALYSIIVDQIKDLCNTIQVCSMRTLITLLPIHRQSANVF